MNEREVIEGLERCRECLCDDCTLADASQYPLDCGAQDRFIQEAVRLLKEHEPVKAQRLQKAKATSLTGIVFTGTCSNCCGFLMEHWKACPICGRKLNWDETD